MMVLLAVAVARPAEAGCSVCASGDPLASVGQAPARFYRSVYSELGPLLSGDPRLGQLTEHLGGVELRWTPWGRFGGSRSLTLVGGYELSIMGYPRLRSEVRAQVFSLGVSGGF